MRTSGRDQRRLLRPPRARQPHGVSEDVLDSLARALLLDEAEIQHLHDLTRAAQPRPTRGRKSGQDHTVRPSLQRFLDAITDAPAWIRNRRMDIIATNPLGRALLAPVLDDPANRANDARFVFLDPAARTCYPEWELGANSIVATLRSYAGQNPLDKELTDLIGELVTRSDTFRHRWSAHNVRFHRTGTKRIHHPDLGDLEFVYEGMDLPGTPDWTLYALTTEPGSPTEERIRLLGSLAAHPSLVRPAEASPVASGPTGSGRIPTTAPTRPTRRSSIEPHTR